MTCEGSRKGLTEGLRKFIQVDHHRALDTGHLSEGLGTFRTRRPKGSKRHPDVTVRESPDELTLRAEEAVRGSHTPIAHKREGEDWGDMYESCKETKVVGLKKPQEAQKDKVLWVVNERRF